MDRDLKPQELTDDSQARWDAAKDAVADLVRAAQDPDGLEAALAAVQHMARGIDLNEIVNALHVPDDAGEHADGLRRLMLRIPDGSGRWVNCQRGWYPIVVELDEQLAALFPRYELHQVKEKFGGLRFYWSEGERITDPVDPEPTLLDLGDDAVEAEMAAAQDATDEAHAAWSQRLERYLQTEEGMERRAERVRRSGLAKQLVDAAVVRASTTCELCGSPGRCSYSSRGWHQTLCPVCADRHGYVPFDDDDDEDEDDGRG